MDFLQFLKYEGVIFDLDGTLVNSMPLHIGAWSQVLEEYGITADKDFLMAHGGVPSPKIAEIYIKQYNLNISPKDLADKKSQRYLETIDTVEIYPQMLELLNFLKDHNITMAIGTGTTRYNVDYIVCHTKLKEYIDFSVCAEDVVNCKPAPDTFLKAALLINANPSKSIVFEDTPLGIDAAVRGKFNTAFVKAGEILEVDNKFLNMN